MYKRQFLVSKKEKEERIEKEYQKKYEKYTLDSARYEDKMARYNKIMSTMDERTEKAYVAITKWEEEIEQRKYLLGHYYGKLSTYRESKMIFIAQKYLEKNLNEADKFRILSNYEELLRRKDIVIDNAEARRYYLKLYGDRKKTEMSNKYYRNYREKDDGVSIIDEDLEKQREKNDFIKNAPLKIINETSFAMKKNKSVSDFGNYAMSTSRLGWINCDRFIKIKEEDKRELAFQADNNTKIYLAFQELNSMLTPTRIGNVISFEGIPTGEKVTIVGIKLKDSKPQIYYKEMTIGENEWITPIFQESSIDEISNVFAKMGS